VRVAYDSLVSAVEEMKAELGLSQESTTIIENIKSAMDAEVPPHGFTAIQALCERERESVFNQSAAADFSGIYEEFESAMRDYVVAREGQATAKRIKKISHNAWKEDAGADRRVREMKKLPADQFRSPYRGQPELYDRGVVLAFEAAVARAIGRPHITWTRNPMDNKSQGVVLAVFASAVQWARSVAWQCSGAPGSEPPIVKAEGHLGIVKAAKRKKTAD
jgi:hypothetical protein